MVVASTMQAILKGCYKSGQVYCKRRICVDITDNTIGGALLVVLFSQDSTHNTEAAVGHVVLVANFGLFSAYPTNMMLNGLYKH